MTDRKKTLQAEVHKHVEAGSALYTDALLSYEGLEGRLRASGDRPRGRRMSMGKSTRTGWRTSGRLLKRGFTGTYVSVEPFHLFRYLDEQAFRYNNRKE